MNSLTVSFEILCSLASSFILSVTFVEDVLIFVSSVSFDCFVLTVLDGDSFTFLGGHSFIFLGGEVFFGGDPSAGGEARTNSSVSASSVSTRRNNAKKNKPYM